MVLLIREYSFQLYIKAIHVQSFNAIAARIVEKSTENFVDGQTDRYKNYSSLLLHQ